MLERGILEVVKEDLRRKMVFLAGPRQVGKTTFAKRLLDDAGQGAYFLWDRREDRRRMLSGEWPPGKCLVVLDEVHKYARWKNWLKGEFDTRRDRISFLVTGSARLDVYRKGGDSLQGRYHHHRLHPLTLAELAGRRSALEPGRELDLPPAWDKEAMSSLARFSGFPEPFLAQSERVHRRLRKERLDRFFREDIRDLERVRELSLVEVMADLLPQRVGSLLSLNSLREDLEVSHQAVSHWMDILERLYFAYRIRPFAGTAVRSLSKAPKAYLWDWTMPESPAAAGENLVASHLLKLCHHLQDCEGHRAELYFLRDPWHREVDFLVAVGRKPWFAVEVKSQPESPSAHLRFFGTRLHIPFLYQVHLDGDRDFVQGPVRVLPAGKLLNGLV